jgi:hypothetical protein
MMMVKSANNRYGTVSGNSLTGIDDEMAVKCMCSRRYIDSTKLIFAIFPLKPVLLYIKEGVP